MYRFGSSTRLALIYTFLRLTIGAADDARDDANGGRAAFSRGGAGNFGDARRHKGEGDRWRARARNFRFTCFAVER